MPGRSSGGGSKALRILFQEGALGGLSDGELVERFLDRGSASAEFAFTALVDRHGPMVLSVCRRALGDPHDAQDAFQATFLTLARRAGSIRNRDSVASWLFGVACRVSSRMRARRLRRQAVEARARSLRAVSGASDPPAGLSEWDDLHRELARLPEAYRAPTVLCYLQELSNEEAAARLQIPVGTVKTRLRRARDLLRARLDRGGEASALGSVAALRPEPVVAVAARRLSGETARMAVVGLSSLSDSAIPPAVASLCRGVLGATFAAKCATGAFGVLVLTTVVGALAIRGEDLLLPPLPPALAERMPPVVPEPGLVADALPAPAPDAEALASRVAEAPGTGPPPRPSVEANVLTGITIDGDLGDWPEAMESHALGRRFHYGGTREEFDGLMTADGLDPDDLRASFRVGYDPGEQLVYLAVVVRDDRLVVSNDSHMTTDAVEVYVDGLRSDAKFSRPISAGQPYWQQYDLSELPVQQYVGLPGPGPIYGIAAGTNPILMAGDLGRTRTRMAYRRQGDVTTYEWAIQPFDRYPDRPTRLEPGRRIGLDVAVADEDLTPGEVGPAGETQANRLEWIYWGPQWSGIKVLDPGSLGELVLGDQPARPPLGSRSAFAEAPQVSGIAVDGDLSDWPEGIARHPIDHIQVLPPRYGWNGLEGADLATSPDLSAAFSVAYDPAEQLVYLAVVVRDDRLVVGHRNPWDTDAVEVYVDGRFSGQSVPASVVGGREAEAHASEFPALQYIGIPGDGPVYGVRRTAGQDRGPDNPILMFGDIHRTATRMAYRREGGVTTYEWAVQPFDRYPDRPTRLEPGRRIGLDVAVVDRDVPATTLPSETEPVDDRTAWLSWYPEYHGLRYLDASHLGEVLLGGPPRPPGGTRGD